jgi:hypothetical protein
MNDYHKTNTLEAADAAATAYYDFVIALGIDEWPQFIGMEMDRILGMRGASDLQKQQAVVRLLKDISAARKRAGKFKSAQQEGFAGWVLVAHALAHFDKRPAPDRDLAETMFNDMQFEAETAERLPAGRQRDEAIRAILERYYDLAVFLRLNTMPGVIKQTLDKLFAPYGYKLPPRLHRKLLAAARKRVRK